MRNALAIAVLAGIGILIAALAGGLIPIRDVPIHAPRWRVMLLGQGILILALAWAVPRGAPLLLPAAVALLIASVYCLWLAGTRPDEYYHGGIGFLSHDHNALVARSTMAIVSVAASVFSAWALIGSLHGGR